MSRIYGSPALFGGTIYTNESGQYVGESVPGPVPGSEDFYDSSGNHVGFSMESAFGGRDFVSDNGDVMAYSAPAVFGGETLYTPNDGCIGWTMETFLGSTTDILDSFEY